MQRLQPAAGGQKSYACHFREGVTRIIVGLAKKTLLATPIGIWADYIMTMPDTSRTVGLAWLGATAYLLQLYFDFSGYSDMAIGFGRLFGFQTPENFTHPYMSKSVVEFWRRWHITLGAYCKAYLYTPIFRSLTGKKLKITGKPLTFHQSDIIALFGTWVVIGIWHGPGLTYFVHGMYYFTFIALERVFEYRKKERRKRLHLKMRHKHGGGGLPRICTLFWCCMSGRSFSALIPCRRRCTICPVCLGYHLLRLPIR